MALSSRLRANVATLFDVFCEVGAGQCLEATILQKYPDDFCDDSTLKSVCQFSFPCGLQSDDQGAVQLFTFVLTDQTSMYTFAYCRYTPRNNSCLVILSGLPWTSAFYKILNHLSNVMNNGNKIEIVVPDTAKLPTLKEDKFMLEFYNAIPEKLMVPLFASLLKERRIIFTSRKIGQLSSCVFAAAGLLYPFHWQSLFIPVLPHHLVDMLMAPMPFLIGVPKKTFWSLRLHDLGDVAIVDLDEKTFTSSHNDTLPAEANAFLRNHLKSSSDMFLSDGLARSFLKTNVLLFGGYRLGFYRTDSDHEIKWDKNKFVNEQKNNLKPFLASLLGSDGVQYLERFIDERLAALNSGRPISDEFEKEICIMDRKSGRGGASPETIQKAVNAVRENASDVVGALKDKMSSMMIRDKIGKLTPKELRRNKSTGGLRKKESGTVEAMSFDTRQWDIGGSALSDGNSIVSQVLPDESSTSSSDLIDFSDPEPLAPSFNHVPSTSSLPTCIQKVDEVPTLTEFSDLCPSAISAPSSSASHVKSRGQWERFD
ncbi:hypothetical protein QR680_002239 [Steinernema hermaphroditum]|uniref:UDENN domain-containing protein n=1 Tax=Steinernema hermaphroditum TaxID=289476 RepID=A0AA39H4P3_9BILA|nr:hypothetical protein QR680_002239 [Steinernema hermaphroditum]